VKLRGYAFKRLSIMIIMKLQRMIKLMKVGLHPSIPEQPTPRPCPAHTLTLGFSIARVFPLELFKQVIEPSSIAW
jgi:hypothetical protein